MGEEKIPAAMSVASTLMPRSLSVTLLLTFPMPPAVISVVDWFSFSGFDVACSGLWQHLDLHLRPGLV